METCWYIDPAKDESGLIIVANDVARTVSLHGMDVGAGATVPTAQAAFDAANGGLLEALVCARGGGI